MCACTNNEVLLIVCVLCSLLVCDHLTHVVLVFSYLCVFDSDYWCVYIYYELYIEVL